MHATRPSVRQGYSRYANDQGLRQRGAQKMKRVLTNFDLCWTTMASSRSSPVSVCFTATIDRMEKARNASVTDNVPSAESLRPANGNTSGPRWHWQLMFT